MHKTNRRKFLSTAIFGTVASVIGLKGEAKAGNSFPEGRYRTPMHEAFNDRVCIGQSDAAEALKKAVNEFNKNSLRAKPSDVVIKKNAL